jgi:hypothetical protein
MSNVCPICNAQLTEESVFASKNVDLVCRQEDHLLAKRISAAGELIIMKLRIKDGAHKFFAQFNYQDNTTSLWTKANERRPIKVPSIISTDLSNLDKIKQKIKTYLLFS